MATSVGFYAAAYWKGRRESLEECTHHSARFLADLVSFGEPFSRWYETAWSKEEALKHPVVPSHDTLRNLLERGVNRKDFGHSIIPQLGYHAALWSEGVHGETAGLSIRCGGYSEHVGNAVVLDLPDEDPQASAVLGVGLLAKILESMARAWHPEWGVVASAGIRKVAGKSKPGDFVGWLTYLTAESGAIPSLPPPSRVIPISGGFLVVAMDERPDVTNPRHVEVLKTLQGALRRRGMHERSLGLP